MVVIYIILELYRINEGLEKINGRAELQNNMSLIHVTYLYGNIVGIIITRTQRNKSRTRRGTLKVRKKKNVT